MNPNPVGMALYEHRDRCSSNAARDKRGNQDHGVEEFEIALDTYCVRASPLMSALRDLAPDVDLFYHNAVPTATCYSYDFGSYARSACTSINGCLCAFNPVGMTLW